MEQIKENEINKIRLENLRKDVNFLRVEGYNIVDIDEERFHIEIKGCLFDVQKLHVLYINPFLWRSDDEDVVTLFLEY